MKKVEIKQVEIPESHDGDKCQYCSLNHGQCKKEVKEFLKNSYGFKDCSRGVVYHVTEITEEKIS